MVAWGWGAKTGFFYAGTNLLCLIWCWFRLPESKDRSFGELDILFENKVPARKFRTTKADREWFSSITTDKQNSPRTEKQRRMGWYPRRLKSTMLTKSEQPRAESSKREGRDSEVGMVLSFRSLRSRACFASNRVSKKYSEIVIPKWVWRTRGSVT